MSPNLRRVQSDFARHNQAMRDLSVLPWAPRAANGVSVLLSKLVLFGLTPLCAVIWALERFA